MGASASNANISTAIRHIDDMLERGVLEPTSLRNLLLAVIWPLNLEDLSAGQLDKVLQQSLMLAQALQPPCDGVGLLVAVKALRKALASKSSSSYGCTSSASTQLQQRIEENQNKLTMTLLRWN